MSNKNDYKSVLHLLTLPLAVRLPHLQHAVLWLSSNLPILLVYNMFGGMIPVHHGSCTRSLLPDLKQENVDVGRKENCTSFYWMIDKLSGPSYVSLAPFYVRTTSQLQKLNFFAILLGDLAACHHMRKALLPNVGRLVHSVRNVPCKLLSTEVASRSPSSLIHHERVFRGISIYDARLAPLFCLIAVLKLIAL